jgi:cell division septation protein DedD
MRNKETGEFELVVGDRQLLSGFFIVVLLLAVVFAMGYEVGLNSPRSGKSDVAASTPAAPAEEHPPAASALPQSAAAAPATEPAAGDGAQPPSAEPPQPTTQPAREGAPAPAAAAPPGSYLQVMACKNPVDAQDLLQTLKDGGMPAFLRSDPDNMAHLLVGPYSDPQSKAKAKSDLESRFGLHPISK